MLAAVQSSTDVLLEIVNLHGDVVGTVPDTESGTPKLSSEATAFGVPTTPSPEAHSWLGSGGLTTEFASGVASGGSGGAYVPQLGLHLAPEALTGAAAQDPVNEYLANEGQAEPTSTGTFSLPGAIKPLPVNEQAVREYAEQQSDDPPPVNAPEVTLEALSRLEGCTGAGACAAGNENFGPNSCHFPYTSCHIDFTKILTNAIVNTWGKYLTNEAVALAVICATPAFISLEAAGALGAACAVAVAVYFGELSEAIIKLHDHPGGCLSIQYQLLPVPWLDGFAVDRGSGCRTG